jgi:acyl-CoA thioester hydrolase
VTSPTTFSSDASPEYGFVVQMMVYFDDLDSFGMLHNSRYFVLAERAWATYWQQRGLAFSKDWELLDDGFIVTKEQRISYEFPVTRPGEYGFHIWLERIGRTSMTYGFRVCSADGTVTHAHGSRTIVRLDRQTLRPSEWSQEGRSVSEKLLHRDTA